MLPEWIKLNRTAPTRLSYFCKIQEKASLDKFSFQVNIFGYKENTAFWASYWFLAFKKTCSWSKRADVPKLSKKRKFLSCSFLTHSNKPFHRLYFTIISNPIYLQKSSRWCSPTRLTIWEKKYSDYIILSYFQAMP